ncbi:longitudinals lacking protein-like [Copidosoma floridanum]|uniref:longitudinals lacking protein-like n=1 Tax=Copidosoma floridanum TaxID=29053 RepID=UPI000C6F6A5F|nr:longitudinals lacking protein-like [Copidosoma floridanum]
MEDQMLARKNIRLPVLRKLQQIRLRDLRSHKEEARQQSLNFQYVDVGSVYSYPNDNASNVVVINNAIGYRCWKCPRVYKREYDMRRHANYECGVQGRHRCPYCNYCNHRYTNLKCHIMAKHKNAQMPEKTKKRKIHSR